MVYDVNIISLLIIGILEIVLSIPLIFEKIPPNSLYGFRTPKTRYDADIWYQANKFAGKTIFLAGLITAGTGFVFAVWGQYIETLTIAWISLLVIFASLFGAFTAAFLYLRRL